jgi:hypothetical protein
VAWSDRNSHTFLFNIKGKTYYNAGMITRWLFFVPCIYFFIKIGCDDHLITLNDLFIGIPLGIVLNVIGVLKMITLLSDKKTSYIFPQRNLLRKDRNVKIGN